MNAQTLFKKIKQEAEDLHIEEFIELNKDDEPISFKPGSLQYINYHMSKYNLENFLEIKQKKAVRSSEDIDPIVIHNFTNRIELYMTENAPNQVKLKEYIKIISIYLIFLSKKPLHPPGMVMLGGKKIIEKEGIFYCPLKKYQLKEISSLCLYCVCKSI